MFANYVGCFHKLTAVFIQYFLLIILSITLIISTSGIFLMYWSYINLLSELFFIISTCNLSLVYIMLIISIYLRANKNSVNLNCYRFSIGLFYSALMISIFGLLLNILTIILGIFPIFYMSTPDKKELKNNFIVIFSVFFAYIISIFSWMNLIIRLEKKTNGSYIDMNRYQEISRPLNIIEDNEVTIR